MCLTAYLLNNIWTNKQTNNTKHAYYLYQHLFIKLLLYSVILIIIKTTKRTISQIYFGKELYMFRTDLLSIIRSFNTAFKATGICHTSFVACLLARSGWNHPDLASRQATKLAWQIRSAVNTVLKLPMMDSRSVQNM